MAIAYTGAGNGGARWGFTGVSSGNFSLIHPGATGSNNIVLVPVAVRRSNGVNVNVSATYDGSPMTGIAPLWNNNASNTSINSGFIQFFYSQSVTTSTNRTVQVSWTSASSAGQAYFSANSVSYSGVNSVSAPWTVTGTEFGTTLLQTVASFTGRRIIQVFAHETLLLGVDIQDYTQNLIGLLDAGYCSAAIGDADGAASVTFQARRSSSADYGGTAIQLLPNDPITVQPPGRLVTLTGGTPVVTRTTGVYVFPGAATLSLSGGAAGVRAPVMPGAPTLTLTGGVPSVNVSGLISPVKATLTLTGGVPVIRAGTNIQPGGATLTLVGQAPSVRPGANLRPGAATLTLTGSPPVLSRGLSVIPASATVLSLVGLNLNITNYMPNQLQGRFALPPYTMQKVDYPASFKTTSITDGVVALNNAIRATTGPKIVFAHDQGAQVASRWMRTYASDPTAPGPDELMFILTGNPLRATGGYAIGGIEIGGATGLPTPQDTQWPIVDVARRWDGWADWVTDENDAIAVSNAEAGKTAHHADPAYNGVDLFAASNTVWGSGNTTFVLTDELHPPLLKNWTIPRDQGVATTLAYKRHIEKTYANRPSNDPEVIVDPMPNRFWADFLARVGVDYS